MEVFERQNSVVISKRFIFKFILLLCSIVLFIQIYTYVVNYQQFSPVITLDFRSSGNANIMQNDTNSDQERACNGTEVMCIPRNLTQSKKYEAKPRLCFTYIISNSDFCKPRPPWLLVYVYSSPGDFERRLAIRKSWGGREFMNGTLSKVIFPLGLPQNSSTQDAILEESKQYKDIIQANYSENYRNLSYKAVTTFHWINDNCPQAKFVLKVDSDIIVNMYVLFQRLIMTRKLKLKRRFLACSVIDGGNVIRCSKRPDLKSCTTGLQYKRDHYPTYCQGGAFISNMKTVKSLHQASLRTPIWWIDDVYTTGILPSKLDISQQIQHIRLNTLWQRNEKRVRKNLRRTPESVLFAQVKNSDHMLRAWGTLKLNWKG